MFIFVFISITLGGWVRNDETRNRETGGETDGETDELAQVRNGGICTRTVAPGDEDETW